MDVMTRRNFLGDASSAVPAAMLLPGVLTQGAGSAQDARVDDPVMVNIGLELSRVLRAMQEGGDSGELGRSFAGILRVQAAQMRARRYDANLRRVLQTRIRRGGLERFLDDAVDDHAKHRRHEEVRQKFQVDLDRVALPARSVSRDDVRKSVNAILSGASISDQLVEVAAWVDKTSARLWGRGQPAIRFIGQNPPEGCTEINAIISAFEIATGIVCAAVPYDPPLAPVCLTMTIGWAEMKFFAWIAGC